MNSSTFQTTVISGFLLFQIVTPLSYYLGGGGPDERFSWRMFSSVRMRECQVVLNGVSSGAGFIWQTTRSVWGQNQLLK